MKAIALLLAFNLASVTLATTIYPNEVVILGSGLTILNSNSTEVQVQGQVTQIRLEY